MPDMNVGGAGDTLDVQNDLLVLISGESGMGKSASLKDIPDKERWIYANCEAGKRPPFKATWYGGETRGSVITDPFQVHEALDFATGNPEIDGVIIDTATMLMEMFESRYIVGAADTMKGWANYAQFWKNLMQQKVAAVNKPVIILGHVKDEFDEAAGIIRRSVPVKGSLKNNGIEAYFSTVVSAKRLDLKKLKGFENDLLVITDEELDLGFKHVFQTRITKDTVGERIRAPMGMFPKAMTYIDNDAMRLMNHIRAFYGA
ncbi:AAA family ATPase [Roseococcus sp.]|uniref:AAA family ATPase n=1 Tax=Roseococcus sp. TaxID=2109646 RepID=UPI003BA8423E